MKKDFSQVMGQMNCKRALEISAVGGHSILLIGTKGSGKTMLAERLETITDTPIIIVEDLKWIKRIRRTPNYNQAIIIGTIPPCSCGNLTHPIKECKCTPAQIQRHLNKLPSFILDRIDIQVEVSVLHSYLRKSQKCETSAKIKQRVNQVKKNMSLDKFRKLTNADITQEGEQLLKLAIIELCLSSRAYDKVMKVARTIAIMDNKYTIEAQHISEAIGHRTLDRNLWIG